MDEYIDSLFFALALQATAMSVPGQNQFLIISTSQQNLAARMLVVIGIASAGVIFSAGASTAIYFSGKAFSDGIFSALSIFGSCYLFYLGVASILGSFRAGSISDVVAGTKRLSPFHAFASGFLVNLSNAKSVIFFGSIFATTLPLASMSIAAHVLVVGAFFLNSVFVHGAISALLSTKPFRSFTHARRVPIQLISGVVFVIFSILSLSYITSAWDAPAAGQSR